MKFRKNQMIKMFLDHDDLHIDPLYFTALITDSDTNARVATGSFLIQQNFIGNFSDAPTFICTSCLAKDS